MGGITNVVKEHPVEIVVVLCLGAILGGIIEKLAAMAVATDVQGSPKKPEITNILKNNFSSSDDLNKVKQKKLDYCVSSFL